jgi:Ca2+-binding RTX toxin-like protein
MAWQFPLSLSTSGTAVDLGRTDNVFVADGVVLASTAAATIQGIGETYAHQVIVAGTVVSSSFDAIALGLNTNSFGQFVRIEAGGDVRSFGHYAINLLGTGSTFINHGNVFSEAAALVLQSSRSDTVATIVNTGVMESTTAAIMISGSETVKLRNMGVIDGATAYTSSSLARDWITNDGTISGTVELGASDDFYSGASGTLHGKLYAGSGDDTATGGKNDDWFYGGAGNDRLTGNAGKDALFGDRGRDVLSGGAGADILYGDAGNDIFIFNAPLSPADADSIGDFANVRGNNDAIHLGSSVMKKLGADGQLKAAFFRVGSAAADANDHVIYNKATGVLSYDSNGNAAGGVTILATISTKPTLTHADFFVI